MGWWRQPSPLGDLLVVTTNVGILRLTVGAAPGTDPLDEAPAREDDVARELDEYFAGTRRAFTVSVDLSSADPAGFPRRVVDTLVREVPWGETVTYGELADMAGAPRAARAVGNVMAHVPVPIVIPAHRVVATNGIGGYGRAGEPVKRALLAIEGVHVR
jgi:methylated-DNA-[protein]-cysteine S-methyltransferase